MAAISAADLVLLRQPVDTQTSVERLYFLKSNNVWTGQVNEEPARGDRTITFDGGVMNDPNPLLDEAGDFRWRAGVNDMSVTVSGQAISLWAGLEVWFGSAAGLKDIGVRRVRTMTSADFGVTGTIEIDWADDLDISNDDFITIKHFYPPWPKYSYFTVAGPAFYKDGPGGYQYTDANFPTYTDPNQLPAPHVIMGRNYAGEMPAAGSVTIQCDATNTVDVAGAGGGSTYKWHLTPYDGAAPFSNDAVGQPTLTIDTENSYWIHCLVEIDDRVGVGHRAVIVGGGITEFTRGPITHNWDQTEIEVQLSITSPDEDDAAAIRPQVEWNDVQDHSLVIIAATDYYGSTQKSITFRDDPDATDVYDDREHIVFCGYLNLENDDLVEDGTGRVELSAVSMMSLFLYSQSLTGVTNATQWYEMHSSLMTVAGNLLHLFRWHSTLLDIADWWLPWTDTVKRSANEEFGEGDMMERARALTRQRFMGMTANPQGEVFVETDLNLRTSAERGAATTTMTFTDADLAGSKRVRRRRRGDTARVLVDGGSSTGVMNSYQPYFSASQNVAIAEARPALVHYDRIMLPSQTEANRLSGRLEAVHNRRIAEVQLDFSGNYREIFSPAGQQWVNFGSVFAATLKANIRDFTDLNNQRGIPRSVTHGHDNATGMTTVSVIFEPQSNTDVSGITQPQPEVPSDDPWDGGWDDPPPPYWPPVPPTEAIPGAGWAADNAAGVWFRYEDGRWEERNTGLAATTTRDLIWDPWQKAVSSNPEDARLYTCGVGFLAVSIDGGKNWTDLTASLSDPPDPWGDCGGIAATGVTFTQIHADTHHNGTFHVIAEAQDITATYWRGWLLSTDDHWITHTWTYLRPLIVGSDGYHYGSYHSFVQQAGPAIVTISNTGGIGEADDNGAILDKQSHEFAVYNLIIDMGGALTGANLQVQVRCCHNLAGASCPWNFWKQDPSIETASDPAGPYTNRSSDVWWVNNEIANYAWGTALPAAGFNATFRYVKLHAEYAWFDPGTCQGEGRVDAVRVIGATATDQSRPLAIDLDSETGEQLYVTLWDGENIMLWTLDVSNQAAITRTTATALGQATDGEITARTYWAFPFTPALPGVASFGDYVYAAGRWDDGTEYQLWRSTDAGDSLTDVSDAAWAGLRIGAFHADGDDLVLYAIVNNDGAGTSALYRSIDTGANWTNMVASTFASEHDAFSKHPSGRILIAANAGIALPNARALTSDAPYNAVVDVSGTAPDNLPDNGDAPAQSGFNSIVWYA